MCVGTCACALGHSVMSDYFETSYTKAHHAFLSMAFPRQEYWNELSFPSPWDLPEPGIELIYPALTGMFLPLSHQGSPPDDKNKNAQE